MIYPRWSSHSLLALGAIIAFGIVLDTSGSGEETEAGRETIHAHAVAMGARPGPNTGLFSARIDRYTSDEELAKWAQVFREGGQEALVSAWLHEEPVVGSAKFAQTLGRDLRVARSHPTEKGRRITLVTDRPLATPEVMRDLRSSDYPIGWIEVEVDGEGRGEGTLVAAAQLEVDDNGNLTVESYGVQPVRLLKVRIEVE